MYQVSRSLFRRLAPHLSPGCDAGAAERLLDACEATMRRLEREPDFARPDRFLFEEIRDLFGLPEQSTVRKLIDMHMGVALQLREQLPPQQRECAAFTRQGTPCRREPRPGSRYCPSHRHLELPAPTPA